MATLPNGNGVGQWRNWALGIAATVMATLIVQGLAFQREMRSAIDINEQRIKALETRARDAIVREFARIDHEIGQLKADLGGKQDVGPISSRVSVLEAQQANLMATVARAREQIIREFDRVDKRLDRLEQGAEPKPGFKLQSEDSQPFNPDELRK
jgi:hypothetical protein